MEVQFNTIQPTDTVQPPPLAECDGASRALAKQKWGHKNLYGLSIALVIVYTAYYGLLSLQSSINPQIGLISLSAMFASSFVSGLISPSILKLLGTKYTILAAFLCILFYILCNFYPSWFTLIPSSIIAGFATRPLWAAVPSHLAEVATLLAPALKKNRKYLIGKFSTIFYAIFNCSLIAGNLASSVILFPYNQEDLNTTNVNATGPEECDFDGSTIGRKHIYILLSVFVVFMVVGIAVLLVVVDHLPTENSFLSTKKKVNMYLKKPLTEFISVIKTIKMLLLAPMALLWGIQLTFTLGTFTEVYISDCFGTYQVGFTLMVLGATSAVMSMVYGRIMKYFPQFLVVLFGSTVNISLLTFLLVWDRVPSYVFIFTFAIGWGVGDAVWSTITTSLAGILFVERSQVAYSAVQVWLGIGYAIGFGMAEVVPLRGYIWTILFTVILATISNFAIEIIYLKKSFFQCCYCKRKEQDSLKLSDVAMQLSVTNPVNNERETSNGVTESESQTSLELEQEDKEVTGHKIQAQQCPSVDNPLFAVYGVCELNALQRNNIVIGGKLPTVQLTLNHQPPLSLLHPHLPALERVTESTSVAHEDRNTPTIRHSQSYMNALDNGVAME